MYFSWHDVDALNSWKGTQKKKKKHKATVSDHVLPRGEVSLH